MRSPRACNPYLWLSWAACEVRRAPFGPGLWPGPRRQARWAGRGLRRSRAGPEDRFCEAVRNDLRVPLTLEGPARTMRGREDVDSASALLPWFSRGAGVGSG